MNGLLRLYPWILVAVLPAAPLLAHAQATDDSVFAFRSIFTPPEVARSFKDVSWRPLPDNPSFNFGLSGTSWCYLLVKPSALRCGQQLLIDNTSPDSVLIFAYTGHGSLRLRYVGGNLVPWDRDRRHVWHTARVHCNGEETFYVVAVYAPAQTINLRPQFLTDQQVDRLTVNHDRIIFGYTGALGLLLLAAIISAFLFRQRLLFYYCGYLLASAGWIYAHYGYAYPLFYPNFPALNGVVKPITSLLALCFATELVFYLIPATRFHLFIRKLLRALQGLAAVLMLAVLLRLFVPLTLLTVVFIHISWHGVLLGSILIFFSILAQLSAQELAARLLIVAFSIPLVMVIFQMLTNSGYVDSPWLNEHGMLLAQILVMLLLAFVVVHTIYRERKTHRQALLEVQAQQRQTLQSLLSIQDAERRRIAQELHDSIGPLLAAIKIHFQRLADVRKTKAEIEAIALRTETIIDDSLAEIRTISHQLLPKGLTARGLIQLLSDYFGDLEPVYATRIVFDHAVAVSLPEEVQLHVYRMICELVLNAARHGQAKKINVTLQTSAAQCYLRICDNGKGFHLSSHRSSLLGLTSMQRRVNYMKGTFQIDSRADSGTDIQIYIPLFIARKDAPVSG
jgi:signal transduction histidine kinase